MAIRNLLVVAVLAGGLIYAAVVSNNGEARPEPPLRRLVPVQEVGHPADAPTPELTKCPSCPIMISVTQQTRRAIHDRKVYFFLNETCEAQWRAGRGEVK